MSKRLIKPAGRYTFRYTDYGYPDNYPDYTAHSGQQVTLLEKVPGDNQLYTILADDDWIGSAHEMELRRVTRPKPYHTLRDSAMALLRKAGVKDVRFNSDALEDIAHLLVPRTSFGGSMPAEPAAVASPRGWRWAPRVRYVHCLGPNLRSGTDIKPFWYVTSNLEGSITKGDDRDDWYAKNIFAHGSTSLEAVQKWCANYAARKYNER